MSIVILIFLFIVLMAIGKRNEELGIEPPKEENIPSSVEVNSVKIILKLLGM